MDHVTSASALAVAALGAAALLNGCSPDAQVAPAVVDAGTAADSAAEVDAVAPADANNAILDIKTTPLTLTPKFAPTVYDYYLRCATGTNAVTLTVTDSLGAHSSKLSLVENQEFDVRGQYWIRCLPQSFPFITVTPHSAGPTPGWYLMNGAKYAMVLDTNGTPVWYSAGDSAVGKAVLNVDSLAPNTLSFMPNWDGNPFGTASTNVFAIHDLTSLITTTVQAVGSPTDPHEFRLLPNGDHLLFTYPIKSNVDLTGLGSFFTNENIADCQVQELDSTGAVVWSWLASDHLDPKQESIVPYKTTVGGVAVVDVFHFNSIDVDATGNLLLSARETNAVYYVDRSTGTVKWKLGGSSYNKDGATNIVVTGDSQTSFYLQHDARLLASGNVTLFDDHGGSPGVARGVEYAIDPMKNVATVAFEARGAAQSQAEGSFRRYADGHSVIGWGALTAGTLALTEVDATGADVLDISLGGLMPYRSIKAPLSQLDITLLRATAGK